MLHAAELRAHILGVLSSSIGVGLVEGMRTLARILAGLEHCVEQVSMVVFILISLSLINDQ